MVSFSVRDAILRLLRFELKNSFLGEIWVLSIGSLSMTVVDHSLNYHDHQRVEAACKKSMRKCATVPSP